MSGLFEDGAAGQAPEMHADAPAPGAEAGGIANPGSATGYRVLARKYRPTVLADLIGQETMVRTLRNAFAAGRVAHAYMLTGVRGVGKTTTARIIARALNCVGPDGTGGPTADPCGVCDNCQAILADRHPDVIEMDAASRTGVDDVREIIEATRFRPLQARTKVFIIDEVHMLSRNAFNALLKTLEEPPPHVKFVFATTELRKVPVTVISRCQRFDLRRVRVGELAEHFAKIAAREGARITGEAVELIARAADGSVRDGLSLLDQAIAQGETDDDGSISAGAVADMLGLADQGLTLDILEAVLEGRTAAALALTEGAHERGTDLGVVMHDLLALVHVVTRLKSAPDLAQAAEIPEAQRTRGLALAERLPMPVLARLWQMLLKGIGEVEAAPDRRAAVEMVLIRLCHLADAPTPDELLRRITRDAAGNDGDSPSGGSGGQDGGTTRAMAVGGERFVTAPVPTLRGFRDVVALVADRREALLHAQLVHGVHLVRFAPPVIELRPAPDAPRDLAPRLARLLQDATDRRWTIALSGEPGEPTLAEQDAQADAARRANANEHPLVRAILEAFPGARLDAIDVDGGTAPGPGLTDAEFGPRLDEDLPLDDDTDER